MKSFTCLTFTFILLTAIVKPQAIKVIESNQDHIKFEINFDGFYHLKDTVIQDQKYTRIIGKGSDLREPGLPWLPEYVLNISVPHESVPAMQILSNEKISYSNKNILSVPAEDPLFNPLDITGYNQEIYFKNSLFPLNATEEVEDYYFRYSRIIKLSISPFQYNPVTRELVFNKKIVLDYKFIKRMNTEVNYISIKDQYTEQYLDANTINSSIGKQWIQKPLSLQNNPVMLDDYWYDPNKEWLKIYVAEKGVYRLTFEQLQSAGMPVGSGVESNKLELYCNTQSVPIDIVDNGDGFFSSGDYIQFVGFLPKPGQYTRMNIYNKRNIYWLSVQASLPGLTYTFKNSFPSFYTHTFVSTYETFGRERDLMYERLGYAYNDQRDFWFWSKATAWDGQPTFAFQDIFHGFENFYQDSNYVTLRIDMHGIQNVSRCMTEHKAYIIINDKEVGVHVWDDQTATRFEKKIYISEDSVNIFPEGNLIKVEVRGDACPDSLNIRSDEIRINWYDFDYWKLNRADSNNYSFHAPPPQNGIFRYWLIDWKEDNIKIYIPDENIILNNAQITNDEYKSVFFVDTVNNLKEYFCAADNYYLTPDSLALDLPSDLRDVNNGYDYIIIAHRNFSPIAEELKAYRESYFPDSTISNPRIKIAYVDDVYDEFNGGLLDPWALQSFVKYAFENWVSPAPSYVVLIGDMSYDYRGVLPTSRPNFIPSIPYHTSQYGQAASDNLIVSVSGNDITPDLALGRLSIETIEEGNILMDKLKSYPADITKEWKQNVLLLSSGLNAEDESYFGFNNASVKLENLYLNPNGIKATKIMRYPNLPQYIQYQGTGPEIRKAINEGSIFVNYYGHGGGYQWDLVFTNDDIHLLQNEGRLPFISSVTCYTAHFDNQDVFGEQFVKAPGKGAIAFFGSSGLTLWGIGTFINEQLFDEIFTLRNYNVGKSIQNAKARSGGAFFNSQIALLTLLGEPLLQLAIPDKPDFVVKTGDISLFPENPIADDTVFVSLKLNNLGVVFPGDSVNIEIIGVSQDTSYIIADLKKESFGETDSLTVPWIPGYGGLYNITVNINLKDPINEMDNSDNSTTVSFIIYDLKEPNIVEPIDGYTGTGIIDFLFSDIGHYLDLNVEYIIEIDTSLSFNQPVIIQTAAPFDGELRWSTPVLTQNKYFWRTRTFDGINYGGWSKIRTFSISDELKDGYTASGKSLQMFPNYNINYNSEDESLELNSNLLPPKPSNKRFIGDINPDLALLDSISYTTITTDGKYIYVANIQYWAQSETNPEGKSKIYKVGTGYGGTTEGEFYGTVPDFEQPVKNQICYHSDGYIYVSIGDEFNLLKVNPETGEKYLQNIPVGIINSDNGKVEPGPQYIESDGTLIYNLSINDTAGTPKYILRILDPAAGWNLTQPDMEFAGSRFEGFTDYFVAMGHFYPSESYWHNEIRRYRLSDGLFEDEWVSYVPFQSYYSWCYDWTNDVVYAGVFRQSGHPPKLSKFQGSYQDAEGTISSTAIGPATKWESVSYNIENQSANGTYNVNLLGLNSESRMYDTLITNLAPVQELELVDPIKYQYLKIDVVFIDSSLGSVFPIKFKELYIDYVTPPEVIFTKSSFTVTPDTTLQGFDVKFDFKAKNIGKIKAENFKVNFFIDDEDSVIYSQTISLEPDSAVPVEGQIISTFFLSPATLHRLKAVGVLDIPEYFTFNNLLRKSFYVARDSIKPMFSITVDGKEIINGDVVSSKPDILITLKDEGPLPMDTSMFTVVYNNIPLNFTRPDITLMQNPWPENEYSIRWQPDLPDGRHVIEVLAKDASGNFFDSTAKRTVFYIFNHFDLLNVYNYPNPFSSETYFTFQLYGDNNKFEEFSIKIYSVAGRLIREFDVPVTDLRSGFNKLFWDGKDQDGDELANGIYFYKVITKSDGEVKTTIQKLAKVK